MSYSVGKPEVEAFMGLSLEVGKQQCKALISLLEVAFKVLPLCGLGVVIVIIQAGFSIFFFFFLILSFLETCLSTEKQDRQSVPNPPLVA